MVQSVGHMRANVVGAMSERCEIDASAIAQVVDRPLSMWTPESLHEVFLKHGCAVVRNAVQPELLGRVGTAVEAAYARTDDVHVYDGDLKISSNRALSGFEIVDDPKLKKFLNLVFSGQLHFKKNATARRIRGGTPDKNSQEPLELHLDSQIHRFQFTVNFWTPLSSCGVDSPTLQFVPLDYLKTRSYSGYVGKLLRDGEDFNLGYFAKGAFDIEAVTRSFGDNCFLRPVMNAGDLVVSSNWLIHGSYRTPAMTKGRTSVELRFIGTDLDIAPNLQSLTRRFVSTISGKSHTNFARAPEPI